MLAALCIHQFMYKSSDTEAGIYVILSRYENHIHFTENKQDV